MSTHPRSIQIANAVAVATGFVRLAMSKIASSDNLTVLSTDMYPQALRKTVLLAVPASTTDPTQRLSDIQDALNSSIAFSWLDGMTSFLCTLFLVELQAVMTTTIAIEDHSTRFMKFHLILVPFFNELDFYFFDQFLIHNHYDN
jgi:hypothetical protein